MVWEKKGLVCLSYEMETEQQSSMMDATLRFGALTYAAEALVTMLASAIVKATLLAPVSTFSSSLHKNVFKVLRNWLKVSIFFYCFQPWLDLIVSVYYVISFDWKQSVFYQIQFFFFFFSSGLIVYNQLWGFSFCLYQNHIMHAPKPLLMLICACSRVIGHGGLCDF